MYDAEKNVCCEKDCLMATTALGRWAAAAAVDAAGAVAELHLVCVLFVLCFFCFCSTLVQCSIVLSRSMQVCFISLMVASRDGMLPSFPMKMGRSRYFLIPHLLVLTSTYLFLLTSSQCRCKLPRKVSVDNQSKKILFDTNLLVLTIKYLFLRIMCAIPMPRKLEKFTYGTVFSTCFFEL